MDSQTNQNKVERELFEIVSMYNVVYKKQLYEYFSVDGRDKLVGRAIKALEKERRIYINPYTQMIAVNETSYEAKEKGTLLALWVLISLMRQKKIEEHFLAAKAEYPVRIIFVGDAEIYDIMYVPETDVALVNSLFSRKNIESNGHIVIVEAPDYIPSIAIENTIGYCLVKEDGTVEYYR